MRHARALVALLVTALLLAPWPLAAQGFSQVANGTFTSNVTLTTTAETVIVSSDPAPITRDTVQVCVLAWAQLTTGTNTTTVTPRIRRGTATGGTLVGEANAETIIGTAGDTHGYTILECEERSGVASVQYSLTLTQAGASANGTALHGGILVMVR